jgi:ribosomal protein S18 acetylase RimI-like enzyme
MEIQELTHARAEEAIELWREAGLTRPWNDPEADLRRAVDGPSSTVLTVLEDGELVATAMVGHDGHRGWIYYLAVRNTARRRGLGAALVGACEAWLAQRDVPKVNLMIRGDNTSAAGFYDALGYARDDVVVRSRRLGP